MTIAKGTRQNHSEELGTFMIRDLTHTVVFQLKTVLVCGRSTVSCERCVYSPPAPPKSKLGPAQSTVPYSAVSGSVHRCLPKIA